MQETLAHTRKSYQANSDLSACTSVPSNGWIERERRERESRNGNGQLTAVDDHGDRLDNENILRIMAEVQEAQPNVKLEADHDNHNITVRCSSLCRASNADGYDRHDSLPTP